MRKTSSRRTSLTLWLRVSLEKFCSKTLKTEIKVKGKIINHNQSVFFFKGNRKKCNGKWLKSFLFEIRNKVRMLLAQFHFTITLDILASTVTQKLKEKKKSDEFGHIKIENFFSTKDTIMRVKKTTYEN